MRHYLSLWHGQMLIRSRYPMGSKAALVQMAEEFCESRGLTMDELRGPNCTRAIAWPRQEFASDAYDTGAYSLPTIGAFLNRDHSTIHHGCQAVKARRAREEIETPVPVWDELLPSPDTAGDSPAAIWLDFT